MLVLCRRSIDNVYPYISSLHTQNEYFVLDTTPSEFDLVNQGVIFFRNKDKFAHFNKRTLGMLKHAAEHLDIPYLLKDEFVERQMRANPKTAPEHVGKTELGRLVRMSGKKCIGAPIQIPTLEYHTNHETTSLKALENYYDLLKRVL